MVASGPSHAKGIVPDPGGTAGSGRYLCENGSWATPIITQLQGNAVAATTPLDTQVLAWSTANSQWQPTAAGGAGANASQLQGYNLAATAPTNNQVLLWNTVAAQWQPGSAGSTLGAADISAPIYASASGTNTLTASLSPAITGYVIGTEYLLLSPNTNTASVTVALNGISPAVTIKKVQGGVTTNLVAGDIQAGQIICLVYDGTNMQLVSGLGNGAPASAALLGTDSSSRLVAVAAPVWQTPTFANSWANYGWDTPVAAYCKTADGELRLRGSITPGSASSTGYVQPFAALPAGYRPAVQSQATVTRFPGGVDPPAVLFLQIDSSGNITITPTYAGDACVIDCRIPLY